MKPGSTLAIFVFVIIALAHAYRLIAGIQVTIDAWVLPQWISGGGIVLCLLLAYLLWRDSK